MRILYGVSGVGLGHSTRAKEIISFLKENNHKVLVFTYGETCPILQKEVEIFKINGIPLHFNKGELVLSKTFYHGAKAILKNILSSGKIMKKLLEFKPEVCISDMEPLVSAISHLYRLPLINIDNQHMMTALDLEIPKEYSKGAVIAKIATRLSAPMAEKHITLSFIKKETRHKNVHIVGPILRKEILKLKPRKTNKIIVYQPAINEKLLQILSEIPENFVVYTYHPEKISPKNIKMKKISRHFIKDLASAKAVIGTAGFSLISESLHLKKPYFAIPQIGQFEQTVNAVFIEKEKFGRFSMRPTKEQIEYFLRNLKLYEANLNKYKMNPKEALLVLDEILNAMEKKR